MAVTLNLGSKPLRWGMIGCGSVTKHKSAPAYRRNEYASLVAVASRRHEKAMHYAQQHDIARVFDTPEALIQSSELDAVYIATPPDSHLDYGLAVARAGKVCCIEKPLAPSFSESKALTNAFDDLLLPLFVAYYRRSLPRFLQIKDWIDKQKIGRVCSINWLFCKPPNEFDLTKKKNWRTESQIARGGYFDDLASHGFDLFAFLLGDFTAASGSAVRQRKRYTAFDTVAAQWKHEHGVVGSGSWSFNAFSRHDEVTIIGESGCIRFSVFAETPIELENQEGVLRVDIEHPETIQQGHVDDIHLSLMQGRPARSTGQTALQSAWVMEQILA